MKKQDFIDHYDQIMEANDQRRLDYHRTVKNYRLRTLLIRTTLILIVITIVVLLIFDPFHNRILVCHLGGPCCIIMAVLLLVSNQYPLYPMMIPPPMLPVEGFEDEE